MATLSSEFQQQLATNPDGFYTVVITLGPNAAETERTIRRLAGSDNVQPIEGLEGFYKATLSGQDILRLNEDAQVQSIDPDNQDFHALN